MARMSERTPLLAADLTFVKVNGGRAYSGLVDWDDKTRSPRVGDRVRVADGGMGPLQAVITEVRSDGTIVLVVPAYAPPGAAAV